MLILSLDLSTHSSGWAVFEDKKLIEYGCITSSSTDLIKRIYIMKDGINNILQKYKINTIIAEEVRPENGGQNPKTTKALMYLQASLEFLIHDDYNNLKIEYVYPSSWRSVCGIKNGRGVTRMTAKEADIKFVKDTYNIEVNDDIADAIAIGHSYIYPKKNELNWE